MNHNFTTPCLIISSHFVIGLVSRHILRRFDTSLQKADSHKRKWRQKKRTFEFGDNHCHLLICFNQKASKIHHTRKSEIAASRTQFKRLINNKHFLHFTKSYSWKNYLERWERLSGNSCIWLLIMWPAPQNVFVDF